VLVDTLGLLLAVHVTAADVSDRDGAMALLGRLDRRRLPRLRAGWVVHPPGHDSAPGPSTRPELTFSDTL
jgi:hypothetical protein